MKYTDQQLDRFSNPPPKYQTDAVIRTHKKVRDALEEFIPKEELKRQYNMSSFTFDVYLQGSYKNSTNIRNSSDIDIVVELSAVFYPDTAQLSANERHEYDRQRVSSDFRFAYFRSQVHQALVKAFGNNLVHPASKCIKIDEHGSYANADVVPCLTHKVYLNFPDRFDADVRLGMAFDTQSGQRIANFPKQHFGSMTQKSTDTNGKFKEYVRMFKALKEELVSLGRLGDGIAPSYYIENLIFNVPNSYFAGAGTYTDKFYGILKYIYDAEQSGIVLQYVCANQFQLLFSDSTWNREDFGKYLNGLVNIWNEK